MSDYKIVDKQPFLVPEPDVQSYSLNERPNQLPRDTFVQRLRADYFSREGMLGDYDWSELCMPRLWPYQTKTSKPPASQPFYALEDKLPVLLASVCGLQHSLSMLVGLITPPIIIANEFDLPSNVASYLTSASLITCGVLSAVQMSQIPLTLPYFGRLQIGTGILSVLGTSFATLSTVSSIATALYSDGTCPMVSGADGTLKRGTCPDGYGAVLGTAAVCGLLEVFLGFLPARVLRKMFPSIITGPVVFLIGASLIGDSGFANWGGGNRCELRPTSGLFELCPTVDSPHALPWGSREFLGLGLSSFMTIVVIEIFGSPAMRSASIVIGLIFPTLVLGTPLHYTSRSTIDSAKAITFIWIAEAILAISNPILGGVTTFLFTTVAVAGLSIMSKIKYTRRNRFILGLSLSLGLGNLLVPTWSTFFLPTTGNRALQGFYNSIQIIIGTPFLISAIVGIIAMVILPSDYEDLEDLRKERAADEESYNSPEQESESFKHA